MKEGGSIKEWEKVGNAIGGSCSEECGLSFFDANPDPKRVAIRLLYERSCGRVAGLSACMGFGTWSNTR